MTIQKIAVLCIVSIVGFFGCSPQNPRLPSSVFLTSDRVLPQTLWQNEQLDLQSSHRTPSLEKKHTYRQNDFQNNAFIVILWASWCPYCVAELPYLRQLAKQGIPLVGVLYKDNIQKAQQLLYWQTTPFIRTYSNQKEEISRILGANTTPSAFIIDSHGVLRASLIGGITKHRWEKQGLREWFLSL